MDCSTFAFDLHVLGTPPALILSQDQTLKLNSTREPSCMALLLFGYCFITSGCLQAVTYVTIAHPLILDGLMLARSI
jgi:hypothetical protein